MKSKQLLPARCITHPWRQVRSRLGAIWCLSVCALWLAFADSRAVWSASERPLAMSESHSAVPVIRPHAMAPDITLLGLGDSLTHGTMDATNNATNTLQAYLQRLANALGQVLPLTFSQPLFTVQEQRISPFRVPSNLGVDGADAFSLEGLEYYKRAGVDTSFIFTYLISRKMRFKLWWTRCVPAG